MDHIDLNPTSHLALVTLAPEPVAAAVAERLAVLFPHGKVSRHSDLHRAAEDHPAARIVLAASPPVEAVARRLAEGADARDALADWVDATAPHLAATRQLRRRLWLVDARAMAAGLPHALIAAGPDAGQAGPGIGLPALPEAIYLVLADILIARHPPAARLAAEIASLCRGPQGVTVDIPMIAAALSDTRGERHRLTGLLGRHEAELDGMRAERERLAAEIDLLREALAQQCARTEAVAGAQATREAELDGMRAEWERLATEVDLLRENLVLQLTDAEIAAATRATLETEVARLSRAAAERQFFRSEAETLARRLESSEAFRLRREAILAGVALADQAEMADLKARESDLAARLSALEADHETAGIRASRLEAAGEAERRTAEALQAELQRVLASKSWKITGPLRSARRVIGPKVP